MKSYFTVRKVILIAIVLLIGCDISLLFAAQDPSADDGSGQQLQQIQQLQSLPKTAINRSATTTIAQNTATTNAMLAAATASNSTNNALPTNNPPSAGISPSATSTSNLASASSLNNGSTLTAQAPAPAVAIPVATPTDTTAANPLLPPPSPSDQMSEDAFNGVTRATLPMTPDQIKRLKQMFGESQQAAATTPGTPPRPTANSVIVSLAPGALPPVIRLAQGFVSSLVFLDQTGAPWPIDAYDIGNPSAFNIQWNKSDSTLLVQANSMYTYGNLAVKLKGLVTPVMITLVPGQQAVDYRVDLRVQGMGPNAGPLPSNGLPNSADPDLLGVLDGIPPAGSKLLNVIGGEGQAWLVNDKLFVRTRLTVLSPSWLATMSSPDGMKAYLMQKTPMLLVSQHGKPIQLKIEGL